MNGTHNKGHDDLLPPCIFLGMAGCSLEDQGQGRYWQANLPADQEDVWGGQLVGPSPPYFPSRLLDRTPFANSSASMHECFSSVVCVHVRVLLVCVRMNVCARAACVCVCIQVCVCVCMCVCACVYTSACMCVVCICGGVWGVWMGVCGGARV